MDRARLIARHGLTTVRQLWNDETAEFRSWEELEMQFHLEPHEQHFYRAWIRNFPQEWLTMLKEDRYKLIDGDWVGVYRNHEDRMPVIVACVGNGFRPTLSGNSGPVLFPQHTPVFQVGSQSRQLRQISLDAEPDRRFEGCMTQVRVVSVQKGQQKEEFLLLAGKLSGLDFDPHKWKWRNGNLLL
jgi:hypothetical protein